MSNSLKNRLSHLVDLRISGFEKSVPPGTIRQLSFSARRSEEWFDEFVGRVSSAIGNHYLPVFRMSDGEFRFSVGYRIPYPPPGKPALLHYGEEYLATYVLRRRQKLFMSGSPGYGYELYTQAEWRSLLPHYIKCLRQISEEGILAIVFYLSPDRFAQQYYDAIFEWLDKHDICITPENYCPFYFAYALLNGPRRRQIYDGRRILVVTSMDDTKEQAIGRGLMKAGATDVQSIRISRNKALLDKISLSGINCPVDVVLVGAGVGAANILVQLRELNTLCIDAGFCIDLLADPSLAGRRYFTLPDNPETL